MQRELSDASPFHTGEQAVQKRLGVHEEIEPWARKVVRPFLTEEHRGFFAALPFIILAARDERGRPWATLVAGAPGFALSPDPTSLQIHGGPVAGDPLEHALTPGADVGLLGIELETRRRNRLNGRVRRLDRDGLLLEVDQSFGNCPQYISPRESRFAAEPAIAGTRIRRDRLTPKWMQEIRKADTLFIATGHRGRGSDPTFGMDASHRGGSPGFVEVADDQTLVIPDYAGNNHFNTIGNLVMNPRVGLTFVDFESGGLLQLTGSAVIDWDSDDIARYPGARRLIRFTLEEASHQERALPLRWCAPSEKVRALRLIEKTRESEDVTSFTFAARDGAALAGFQAGQHLPIELDLASHSAPVLRTYSLSNAPSADRYRISVKREARGLVSRELHDSLEVGAILSARAPAGDFVLDHGTRPAVFLSAGIGSTPLVSMLHTLVQEQPGRPAWFVHGARDGQHHALRSEVEALAAEHHEVSVHVSYSRPLPGDQLGQDYNGVGRLDGALLDSLLPDVDAEFYLCGPLPFMAELQSALESRGVPDDQIHSESFGPLAQSS